MANITAPFPHVFRYPIDGVTAMAVHYDDIIRPVFELAGHQVIIVRETGGDVVLVEVLTAGTTVVPGARFVAEARLVVPKLMNGPCPAATVGARPSLRACCAWPPGTVETTS